MHQLFFGNLPASANGFFQTAAERTAVVLALVLPISLTAVNIVCCWLLFTWVMADRYRHRWHQLRHSPWVWWNLALFGLLGIGVLYSTVSFQEAGRMWLSYLNTILFLVVSFLFQNADRRKQAMCLFSIALGIRILYNVYREVFLGNTDFASYGQFLGNYNTFGLFVLIWIVTLIHRPLSNRRLSALRWGVILGLLYLLFWKTGSRSCHLAMIALIPVLLWQYFSLKGLISGLICAAILGSLMYLIVPKVHSRFSVLFTTLAHFDEIDRSSDELRSSKIRFLIYQDTLQLAAKRPLFGFGTGSVGHAYREHTLYPTDNAHSEYFQVILQTGLTGLVIFLLWIGALWRRARKLDSLHRRRTAELLVIVFIFGCFFQTIWSDATAGYAIAYFLAWGLAEMNDPPSGTPSSESSAE
jgi:O-antigen ligase